MDLVKEAAYSGKTPYELWQEGEGIPVVKGLHVQDLKTLPLSFWGRMGASGAFINLLGAGRSCDAYVCEIAPKGQTKPQRHMYEELIYILKGRGATTVWNEGGPKQTFEWQEGSLFSPPLNSFHEHFNVQGDAPARYLALTDAPQMISRFRNIDFIFNNPFCFTDRFNGDEGYFDGQGKDIPGRRTWESNFIPDIPGFLLKDHSARGPGARGILLHLSANTISAHIEEYPVGTYPRAHRHGPGAHILILAGEGYTLIWEAGKPRTQVDWKPGSLVVPPAGWFHQHFNPGREPARYIALKPWGFTFQVEELPKTLELESAGGTQVDYKDQDPEIHDTFVRECKKRGVEVKLKL